MLAVDASSLFIGISRSPFALRRPLGAFSFFIIEDLPGIINGADEQAKQKAILVLDELSILAHGALEKLTPADLSVARLDIMMAQAAVYYMGLVPGVRLKELAAYTGKKTNRPACLTYEDIILSNPPSDLRVFSTGKTASAEADFYLGHRLIEDEMQRILTALESILKPAAMVNGTLKLHQEKQAESALLGFSQVVELMRGFYQKLKAEDFIAFRGFFASRPDPQEPSLIHPGPSGLYSATMPCLDVLVDGASLPTRFYEEVRSRKDYYPLKDYQRFEQACALAESGQTLAAAAEGHPSEGFRQAVATLRHRLGQFRGAHLQAVKKHLPEVLAGQASGTGGGSADMLKSRLGMHARPSRCPVARLMGIFKGGRSPH
ncbi:MAG: hypothetical protein AB7U41_02410 [Dongiaceae bacterium]